MGTGMRFLKYVVLLSGVVLGTTYGGPVNSAEKDRIAITEDGKRVILKGDGTWRLAPDTAPAKLTLPSTKRTGSSEVTLFDVYKTDGFYVPGIIPMSGGTTHKSQAGYELVVVRWNTSRGSNTLHLYDSTDTLCNEIEAGRRTDTWSERAYEVPIGRKLGRLSVGEITFDLTGMAVRSKK